MQPVVYADLRCLQDEDYRVRGIGQHFTALLRTREQSAFSRWKTIGLVDPLAPKLPAEYAALVDEVSGSANACCNGAPAVFIDGTPMTHDTRLSLRFENHPSFFRAAVIYDFIPLDWPGYLPTIGHRIDYLAKMARLRKFDLFFPISEYTAWRLSELLGVSRDRMCVTGASVRRSLFGLRDRLAGRAADRDREPYFLVLTGPDARKNAEVVIKAVRNLNLLYGRRIPLKIAGHYGKAYRHNPLGDACHRDGEGFLELYCDISEEELVSLYLGATATIAPSHIEGFSLPIVEASMCGCPIIVSTCAAHMELIDREEALFPSDDAAVLCEKLEALLNDPALRRSLVESQAHLQGEFHEDAVGRRFWSALDTAIENRRNVTFTSRCQNPRLAFLSPYPPDHAGPAFYTANTIRAGEHLFHSDLYTDAARPLTFEGNFRDAGGISIAPLLNGRYNAVISVLGNSHFHTPIFEVFERYGGPCILHDARLIQIYFLRLGQEKFLKFATRFLGRSVAMEEFHNVWSQDPDPPSLFLEPIIERASPLIVHTVTQQAEIKKRYGIDAQVTTCCPTAFFANEALTTSAKEAARQRLGIPSNSFLVSSFGIIAPEKGMHTNILAVELLRSWNVPAELHFVGNANVYEKEVNRIAALHGIAQHVHAVTDFVDDATYRDFLVASDAAIQLRTYGFGQFSAALTDCISAGLPCVASSELAKSCDAPIYVSTVPNRFSPLQVAEQLALIWEARPGHAHADARSAYLETHNFEYYGKRLIEILGIA
jgi:glycosyltransferase involved in cell wall biosynthesis